jgi:hypothetical protein
MQTQRIAQAAAELSSAALASMAAPRKMRGLAHAGLGKAFARFAALFAIACLAGALVQFLPIGHGLWKGWSGGLEEALSGIPDFEIADGRLILKENVTQPYLLSQNVALDTTGKMNEPPVDENGEGMLVTSEGFIRRQGNRDEKYYFRDIQGSVSNKADLARFMKLTIFLVAPMMLAFALAFNVLWFAAVCGICSAVLAAAAAAYYRVRGGGPGGKPIACMALYAQTPVLVAGLAGNAAYLFLPHMSLAGIIAGYAWGAWAFSQAVSAKNG